MASTSFKGEISDSLQKLQSLITIPDEFLTHPVLQYIHFRSTISMVRSTTSKFYNPSLSGWISAYEE